MAHSDPSPPESPVQPGEVVAGKYRVERVLAIGGMGAVVAARHEALDQPVAIKVLLREVARRHDAVERFLREARAAARLRSDHAARVFDVGTHGELPYLAMELLDGVDLADEVAARGALPIAEAVSYVLQALEAIAEAHAIGIVHRDLKPANLFLSRPDAGTRRVKVLDFGISKVESASHARGTTTTGDALLGSPAYMSPEQVASARHVDVRSDFWSIGAVLYELLSGSLAYDGETPGSTFAKILRDERVPLRDLRPEIPPELDAVVSRCLMQKREQRYGSAAELARALAPFASAPARALIPRIESRGAGAVPEAPMPAVSGGRTAGSGATEATWAAPRGGKRGRRLQAALAIAGACALLAGGWWLGNTGRRVAASGEPTSGAAGSVVVTPVPPSVPDPSVGASTEAPPTPAVVPVPVATPSQSARAPRSGVPHPRPRVAPPPGRDHLPSEGRD